MPIVSGKSMKNPSFKMTKTNKKAKVVKRCKVGYAAVILSSKDEEMDIKRPLFPLDHYINDRIQFTDELFRTMNKQGRLDAILPDILKDISIDELKSLCVQQLEIMSKKRIRSILKAIQMDSSSGTEDSGNEDGNEGVAVETSNPQVADSTGLDITEDDNANNQINSSEKHSEEVGNDLVQNSSDVKESDFLELHPDSEGELTVDLGQMDVESNLNASESPTNGSATIARTYLEILELEMRARAIKSLLKSHPLPADT